MTTGLHFEEFTASQVQKFSTKRVFYNDVIDGLLSPKKHLPYKYFYDAAGMLLFNQICGLEEYYLTRRENAILHRYLPEMADRIGARARIVEFGAGSGIKTELLLSELEHPSMYIPIANCDNALDKCASQLGYSFPLLSIAPVIGDYTDKSLFSKLEKYQPFTVFMPGSTLGNFDLPAAQAFMRRVHTLIGKDGGMLVGVDLMKDMDMLLAAYNDKEGITAAFNKNLLARINRELDADFDLDAFEHKAIVNIRKQRVEMHLVSLDAQTVHIGDETVFFHAGESIHTENSYKYTLPTFKMLAEISGFCIVETWTDEQEYYSVHYLKPA